MHQIRLQDQSRKQYKQANLPTYEPLSLNKKLIDINYWTNRHNSHRSNIVILINKTRFYEALTKNMIGRVITSRAVQFAYINSPNTLVHHILGWTTIIINNKHNKPNVPCICVCTYMGDDFRCFNELILGAQDLFYKLENVERCPSSEDRWMCGPNFQQQPPQAHRVQFVDQQHQPMTVVVPWALREWRLAQNLGWWWWNRGLALFKPPQKQHVIRNYEPLIEKLSFIILIGFWWTVPILF